MSFRSVLFAGAAALALVGCGGDKSGGGSSAGSSSAASVNAGSPIDDKFKLNGAEALDFDAFLALLPEDGRPTYEAVSFDDKIGATVVTNLVFKDAEGAAELTIAKAEFYGVDLDAMQRVKDASEAKIDAPFETFFSKIRLFDISVPQAEGEAQNVSVAAVELDKLEVRQGAYVEPQEGDANPAHAFNSFRLGGFYVKGVDVSAQADGSAIALSAPDLRFVGFGGGKLDAFIAKDLEYQLAQGEEVAAALSELMGPQGAVLMNSPLRAILAPDTQKVAMSSLVWRGFDLSGLVEYGVKGEDVPADAKDLVKLGSMEAKDAKVWVNDKLAYTGEKATFKAEQSTWLIPSKIEGATNGDLYDFTAYVPDSEEAIVNILTENGLNAVKSSTKYNWDWNSKSGDAAFVYDVKAAGLADISMTFDMADFDIAKIREAYDAGDKEAFGTLTKFVKFETSLRDYKMLDVIFAIAGLQMQSSGDDLRQSAPAMIRLGGAQAAQFNPRIADYVEAAASFVGEGGSLTIKAAPEAPVAFGELAKAGQTNPVQLPDVINLTVTHEE